jgi:hypothetical protein
LHLLYSLVVFFSAVEYGRFFDKKTEEKFFLLRSLSLSLVRSRSHPFFDEMKDFCEEREKLIFKTTVSAIQIRCFRRNSPSLRNTDARSREEIYNHHHTNVLIMFGFPLLRCQIVFFLHRSSRPINAQSVVGQACLYARTHTHA